MDNNGQLASSVSRVCARLDIGKTTFYELIAQGKLSVFRIGKKTLVSEGELQRFIGAQSNPAADERTR